MDDGDKETIEAARLLANIIVSPHVEGPCGQSKVVDALAVRMLWEERQELDEVDELEVLRLWSSYLAQKREAELTK